MRKMNKKGFTLVELMVVLAILGLLAAIGIPQYTKVMERAKIGRDVAVIATVQTVVDTFVWETDWLKNNNSKSAELGTGSVDQVRDIKDTIKATSYLTGGEVALKDFFDAKLPQLESKDVEGANWYINKEGLVYVGTTLGTPILPGSVSKDTASE